MNANLPQLDLPSDYIVGTDITEDVLSFYQQACRLKAGIFVICLEGKIKVSINLTEYEIKANDFITLMPGSIIQFCEQKEKVRLSFIGFSSKFMDSVNLTKTSINFLPTLHDHPIISLTKEMADIYNESYALMNRLRTITKSVNPETVKHVLLAIIYGISELYKEHTWPSQVQTRSDEICKKFIQLVMTYYTTNRQTSFYASQLSISSQHLCMTVKQKTGRSVSDIIADVVIMDAKSRLKSTDCTVQEISYSLNFPNVSFFGKYFKRYVGVSPQKYRNS